MAGPTGTRVLALPPTTVLERSVATLEDIAATVEPDAVWLFGYAREPTAAARARHVIGRAGDSPAARDGRRWGAPSAQDW